MKKIEFRYKGNMEAIGNLQIINDKIIFTTGEFDRGFTVFLANNCYKFVKENQKYTFVGEFKQSKDKKVYYFNPYNSHMFKEENNINILSDEKPLAFIINNKEIIFLYQIKENILKKLKIYCAKNHINFYIVDNKMAIRKSVFDDFWNIHINDINNI